MEVTKCHHWSEAEENYESRRRQWRNIQTLKKNNKNEKKNILEQLFYNVINENKKNIIAELLLLW